MSNSWRGSPTGAPWVGKSDFSRLDQGLLLMKMLALMKYGNKAASTRQRLLQYREHFSHQGIETEFFPLLDNDYLEQTFRGNAGPIFSILGSYLSRVKLLVGASGFDLIWVHCENFPYMPGLAERLTVISGKPVVYDFDDAIFHQYDTHSNPLVRRFLGKKLQPLMRGASLCVCGNSYLKAYADRFSRRTEIVPTVLDTDVYKPTVQPRDPARPVTVGWIGSPSTWPFEFFDWSEDEEITSIQGMDIGIMPLPNEPWARGKCGYKLIQYMACGIPVIASPVGVNSDIVNDGVNGYLACSEHEWEAAIRRLAASRELRGNMGAHGRQKIVNEYSLHVHGPRLAALLREVANDAGA